MSIRNLDALFSPQTVALVGASNRAGSIGAILARNMTEGGFRGPIMTVNPHETAIRSSLSYHSVAELPLSPDLAVIATPPDQVAPVIAELGAKGCRAAVVITAGFGEGEQAGGRQLRQDILDAARPHMMRLVGPNCLGVILPGIGLNASFAHLTPARGDIAFVGQSGAMATTILDWAADRRIGFSQIVSLGDMADVDFGDMLDYLALDPATRTILLYVEAVTSARKFMSAARIAARAKPVIVLKAGRSREGARAAVSHTGALAGADLVYDAAFRQAGLLRVNDLRDLLDAAETLTAQPPLRGERLTIVTNGGGAGVLATDALIERGGRLAELPEPARAGLDQMLPKTWPGANPVDILGDADGQRYAGALRVLLSQGSQDAILVMNCPTGLIDGADVARKVAEAVDVPEAPPIFTVWLGEATAGKAREAFTQAGLATYETPDDAVRAFSHLVDHHRNQALLLETPTSHVAIDEAARGRAVDIVQQALGGGRTVLTEPEAKAVLGAYGVPVVPTLTAETPAEAVERAKSLGFPVALKILSPDITHKSDLGGVRLNLCDADAVAAAARQMLLQVAERESGARIEGFTVQPMVNRPGAIELLAGMTTDHTFGPVVLFGQGGAATEVVADRAAALPPFCEPIARDLIRRTRVSKLMAGYRNVAPVAPGAVEEVLCRLAALAADIPEIAELDINPLLADATGVVALDARIVVAARAEGERDRLAMRPYPIALAHDLDLPRLAGVRVRPIRPDDEAALVALVSRCDRDDLRFRFWGAVKTLPHGLAARLSQIDYDREMALIAVRGDDGPDREILGVARLVADPDFAQGEYALLVRSDVKDHGLGWALMNDLLDYARSRGIGAVYADELSDNAAMLKLAAELGARHATGAAERGTVRIVFDLKKARTLAQA